MPEANVVEDPPVAPPTDRPGYATTEFWITLTGSILTFVTALLAILTPGFTLNPQVSAAVGAFCPLAAMVGGGFYAMSRARTKQATGAIAQVKMSIDWDREQQRKEWEIACLAPTVPAGIDTQPRKSTANSRKR